MQVTEILTDHTLMALELRGGAGIPHSVLPGHHGPV